MSSQIGPPAIPYGRSQPYQRPLTVMERKKDQKMSQHQDPPTTNLLVPEFSDLNNTFEVEIKRNSLGLGFSISGGPDAPSPWTNLIRVKKIFPLQPAWETGKLKVGDIILRVSGIPLASLNLRQALDILRTSPPQTLLQVCRVSDNSGNSWCAQPFSKTNRASIVRSYSYGPVTLPTPDSVRVPHKKHSDPTSGRPPLPPLPQHHDSTGRPTLLVPALSISQSMDIEDSPSSPATSREWSPVEKLPTEDLPSPDTLTILAPVETTLRNSIYYGEFTISLTKVNGSLGFTLRQLDDTVLKHTIKALVKEPAISDGRIRPGDKLLSANGVYLTSFSHQEVITFLRQLPDTSQLVLYRDASRSQTPLTPEHSPIGESAPSQRGFLGDHKRSSQSPSRKHLRYEAAELVRSLQSSRTSLEKAGLSGSYTPGSGTLGRRLANRPYSPQLKEKFSHQSPQPRIESPHNSSAPASLLHQGVTQALNSLRLDTTDQSSGLVIEEMLDSYNSPTDSQHYSPDIQEVLSAPQSPSDGQMNNYSSCSSKSLPRGTTSYLIGPDSLYGQDKPERPSELNLNSGQSRKQGFVFNNNWNNVNKF